LSIQQDLSISAAATTTNKRDSHTASSGRSIRPTWRSSLPINASARGRCERRHIVSVVKQTGTPRELKCPNNRAANIRTSGGVGPQATLDPRPVTYGP
jgi:hypothetical protein